MALDNNLAPDTIAHEYQHLIHFKYDYNEEVWLNEGMSVLAEYLCGYVIGWQPYVEAYFDAPERTSLTYWNNLGVSMGDYGASFLFMLNLFQKYQQTGILTDIVKSQYNGLNSIVKVLDTHDFSTTEEGLLKNWCIANLAYTNMDHRGYPAGIEFNTSMDPLSYYNFPVDATEEIPKGGVSYFSLPTGNAGIGFVEISALSDDLLAFILIIESDSYTIYEGTSNGLTNSLSFNFPIKDSPYQEIVLAIFSTDPVDSSKTTMPKTTVYTTIEYSSNFMVAENSLEYTIDNRQIRFSNLILTDHSGGLIGEDSVTSATVALINLETQVSHTTSSLMYNSTGQCWYSNFININHEVTDGDYYLKIDLEVQNTPLLIMSEVFYIDYDYYSLEDYQKSSQEVKINRLLVGNTKNDLWDKEDIDTAYLMLMAIEGSQIKDEIAIKDLYYDTQQNVWYCESIDMTHLHDQEYVFLFVFVHNTEDTRLFLSESFTLSNEVPGFSFVPSLLICALLLICFKKRTMKKP